MKKKLAKSIFIGAMVTVLALPMTVTAAGRGGGSMGRQGVQSQTRATDQQRLRDGSCVNQGQGTAGAASKKGYGYGPGDGTGNSGAGPKDGTGYGAPSQR